MLLEREREIEELGQALLRAGEQRGGVWLIEAAAGLGKTSLMWSTFETAARTGFTCLRARGSELEHDFPYGCVRQLLEPVVTRSATAERERLFEDAARLSMPLFSGSDVATPPASADSAFAMLHGLYWLLNKLSRDRPVLLCIDDLQWSDLESLRFLSYLAPRLDGLPVAVIATVRAGENVTPDLARLLADDEVRVLRPGPLSVEATAKLCERTLGTSVARDFVAACHNATSGNPFFLQTLLREAKELRFLADASEAARVHRIGPAAVARAVLLRLSSATPAATSLVRAVAILGDDTSVVDAAGLAGLPADEAARAADALIELAILRRGSGLEFAHPIVRHAIYEDIGANERARAHARAALILAERGAADERIAAQLAKSEPIGDAGRVALLSRVAARALVQGAPAAAVAWLTRALHEPPSAESRAQLLFELGNAEVRLGMPQAAKHLSEAVATLQRGEASGQDSSGTVARPELLAIAVRQLANSLAMAGTADPAVQAIEAAITVLESTERELALILEAELAAKAQQASRELRAHAARRLARHRGVDGAGPTGDTPGERLVRASIAFERARVSETEAQAVQHLEAGLARGGLVSQQQPDVVGPFYALMIGLLATDALELGHRWLERALDDARPRGSIPAMAFLTVHRGWYFLRGGAVAQAEADARTTLDLMHGHGIALGNRFALALLVAALIETGQVDEAAAALRDSGIGDEIPPGLAHNNLLEVRGLLHLAQGKAREGFEDLREFGHRDEIWGAANALASRWRSHAALALRSLGDEAGARRMASEELARARRWGAASGIGQALRAAALVDDDEKSIARLEEAVTVLRDSPARLEHARALTDLGAASRRANRRADARTSLQESVRIARACGATALAERAELELRAAGGRSSNPTAGLEQLTVSERRVAELAAQGRSNPQIAQALFVTRKTVETHLGRVYSKLGIDGRGQLQQALTHPGN